MKENNYIRMKIFRQLEKLLTAKNIEKVTVTELCKRCGISRTTFYLYFQDIYSVRDWYWENNCQEILLQIGDAYGWYEGFCRLYSHMQRMRLEDKSYIDRNLDKSHRTFALQNSLSCHVIQLEKHLGRPLTQDEMLQLSYASLAISSISEKWIAGGMQESAQWLARIAARIAPEFVIRVLGQ